MRASRRTATAALVLLVLSFGFLIAAGHGLGIPLAPLALGLFSGMSLAFLATRALFRRKATPRSRPGRVLPGGRVAGGGYDLAKDKTTDDQRWLM
jgi:hypothetical protein